MAQNLKIKNKKNRRNKLYLLNQRKRLEHRIKNLTKHKSNIKLLTHQLFPKKIKEKLPTKMNLRMMT